MLLIAQRVVVAGGQEGYNAFCHLHGSATNWVWELPEGVPDRNPGYQATSLTQVRGPGRVRSFLDLAFPDGQRVEEVTRWAHDALLGLIRVGSRLPLSVESGPWFARFEVDSELLDEWHDELHRLQTSALELWNRTIWVTTGQPVERAGVYRFVCFESGASDPAAGDKRVTLSGEMSAPSLGDAAEKAVWVLE